MKQFKLFFLLFVLMSMLSNKVWGHNAKVDGIYYNFSGNEATVTYDGYYVNKYSGNVVIPETVECNGHYTVTKIDNYAFSGCSGLTSIVIPGSVTSIGEGVFSGCSGLTTITVESGNTKYDSRNNCNAIIETSSNKLIAGCKNTIISNSITSIGNDAFYNCSGLTSIEIPGSVTNIGDYAFSNCI